MHVRLRFCFFILILGIAICLAFIEKGPFLKGYLFMIAFH